MIKKYNVEPVIKQKLEKNIFGNDVNYFFTSLTNRFDYANELLKKVLENKYNKVFKPIYIYSCDPGPEYEKENYLIVNKEIAWYQDLLHTQKVIYGQEYEDLNVEVSESLIISKIIDQLATKQEKIFYISFTSSFLRIKHPKLIIIGPNPDIVTKYDNKLEQYKLFEQLALPIINFKEYHNYTAVEKINKFPYYLTSLYTSGGCESTEIFSEEDLGHFYKNLREINKNKSFVVSDFIDDILLAPNVNAIIINENDVRIISITDQILNGNACVGNIFPSSVTDIQKQQIHEIIKKIGNYLGHLGYKGVFGCDFIIDSKNTVFVNDLNPRRQGGYLCNILLSKNINLIEQELLLALGEKVSDFDEKDFIVNFSWAHSKIKVSYAPLDSDKYKKLVRSFNKSSLNNIFENIGSEYITTFYPKGYIITCGFPGYCAFSDFDRKNVEYKIRNIPQVLLNSMAE